MSKKHWTCPCAKCEHKEMAREQYPCNDCSVESFNHFKEAKKEEKTEEFSFGNMRE